MDISIIVFAGIVVCGISALPFVFRGVHNFFKDIEKFQNKKQDKLDKEKIATTKEELKKVTISGSLSDLINISKKLGDKNKERIENNDRLSKN